MTTGPFNVLFLCTGNSARSILAEALLGRLGGGRFRAFSAGSHPTGRVNPFAFRILETRGFPTAELRSKNWNEFAVEGAPKMDFIFTVCDSAAGEICPLWPGQPVSAHWGVADPAAARGTDDDKRAAFVEAFEKLRYRVAAFVSLPFDTLDANQLKRRLTEIGTETE